MLNVRLNQEMEEKLNKYSLETKSSKSAIVKEALALYFSKDELKLSAYELGADLFGSTRGSNPNASTTYKKRLKQKLNEKHAH